MSFIFGMQQTRDSLKGAFEDLFEKYGHEFDDDDEIDIMSLEVVRRGESKRKVTQKPKKFGFLYKKKGEVMIDDEDSDIDNTAETIQTDPADLEKIFNERSTALVSASTVTENKEQEKDKPKRPTEAINERGLSRLTKRRKLNKRSVQCAFEAKLMKLVECELGVSKDCLFECAAHGENVSRDCFDCSLINLLFY